MSKVDGTRAIREARFEAARAAARAAAAVKPAAVKPAAAKAAPSAPVAESVASTSPAAEVVESKTAPKLKRAKKSAAAEPSTVQELCGHRSMNGRSCRRPAGHAEKSHRYS